MDEGIGLEFRRVDAATRRDFVALFQRPGHQKQCWCMVWRATPEEGRGTAPEVRRGQMLARIESGVPVGLLAYHGDKPVGWVSIAPKASYRRLGGPEPGEGENIWSLACMLLLPAYRRQGLAHRLIAAAVAEARSRGATAVEAYPVDDDSPSYRFMGFVSAYRRAGFRELGREGKRRHVMRLAL